MTVLADTRRQTTVHGRREGRAAAGDGRAAIAARRAASRPLPRRSLPGAVRARRRQTRVGLILGGIVLAFVLALLSLSQTIAVSATTYDIDRLLDQRARLEDHRQEIRSQLERLGREPAVRKLALDGGLIQLANPLVVPAR